MVPQAIQIEADKIIRQLEQTLSRKLSDSSLSSDEVRSQFLVWMLISSHANHRVNCDG